MDSNSIRSAKREEQMRISKAIRQRISNYQKQKTIASNNKNVKKVLELSGRIAEAERILTNDI
jgi:hypothetical protein